MKKQYVLTVSFVCALVLVLFVAVSIASSNVGDVNGDGVVTMDDAKLVFNYVSGSGILTKEQLSAADIDRDGRVTVADATQIFHYVNGVLQKLPYTKNDGERFTILSLPDKLNYTKGESLDLTGLVACVTYKDGTSKEVKNYTVTGFDGNVGTNIIILSYNGMKTAFTVTVYPKEITKIEIAKHPTKLKYKQGEALDLKGLVVNAVYSDGTKEAITSYAVSGFAGTAGENIVKIQYGSHTAWFAVNVEG